MSATGGLIGACEWLPEDAKCGQEWAKTHDLPGRVPPPTPFAKGAAGPIL